MVFRIQNICARFGDFGRDVAYRAIEILDRLALLSPAKYQDVLFEYPSMKLLIVAAILIAFKFEQDTPSYADLGLTKLLLRATGRDTYFIDQDLYRVEQMILAKLNWQVDRQTDLSRLHDWLEYRGIHDPERERRMLRLLDYAVYDLRKYQFSREELFYGLFVVTHPLFSPGSGSGDACVDWLVPISSYVAGRALPDPLPADPFSLLELDDRNSEVPFRLKLDVPDDDVFQFHYERLLQQASL
jgi:hypothetical protein